MNLAKPTSKERKRKALSFRLRAQLSGYESLFNVATEKELRQSCQKKITLIREKIAKEVL